MPAIVHSTPGVLSSVATEAGRVPSASFLANQYEGVFFSFHDTAICTMVSELQCRRLVAGFGIQGAQSQGRHN